jgi:hypothetical protein
LHGRWVTFPEFGGAFYVCEQECESACRRAGHDTLMSSLLPLKGHYSSGGFFGSFVRPSTCGGECAALFESLTRHRGRPRVGHRLTGCSTVAVKRGSAALPHSRFTCKSAFFESGRADSNRFPAHYECAVSGCRALRTIAIPAYLSRFLFSALRISLPQLSTHGSSVEEDSLSPSPRVITSASPAPASSAAPAPPRGRGSPPTATAGGRGARTRGT